MTSSSSDKIFFVEKNRNENSILNIICNSLFPFFSTIDILPCRLVCKEFNDAISNYPWNDIYTVVLGNIEMWRRCFPKAKAININELNPSQGSRRRHVRDNDIRFLQGIKYINISKCHFITDNCFEYLSGVKCILMNYCYTITGDGFRHLTGIKRLECSYNSRINDSHMIFLKGIKYLNIIECPSITDDSFIHFSTLVEVNIASNRHLTDKAFNYLKNVQAINISNNFQDKITPEIFTNLNSKKIKYLIMDNCSDLLISSAVNYGYKTFTNWAEQHKEYKSLPTLISLKIY